MKYVLFTYIDVNVVVTSTGRQCSVVYMTQFAERERERQTERRLGYMALTGRRVAAAI